ncbi:MAG: hypothetical protein IT208_00165 [Chthonomonadales bacterium]|nr:hypothetical protein [Chthonomonadales bacterium]
MKLSLALAAVLLAALSLPAAGAGPKKRPAPVPRPAAPAPHNRFVTVEEVVRARRAPAIAVSVEGYVVLARRLKSGSVQLSLADSIDHVLSERDADALARAGAQAVVPAVQQKRGARWAWSAAGLQRLAMYIGAARAERALRDTAPKVRVTGWTAKGRAVISPVTGIEYQDDNGDWKRL